MKLEELREKHVLVVDDDPLMLMLLDTVLRDTVRVIAAEGGDVALARARSTPAPDLVVLDVGMPGMNGHEVCRRLKADPATRDIPVMFMTAACQDEDEAVGFNLGAVDYITKPFRVPVVQARVRAHLETQHLYRQIRQHNLQLDEKVRQRTLALEAEIRSRRQAEDRFVHQVYHDPLTSLPNRMLLQRSLADRSEQRFGLLLLTLSGFHEVNNTLGYENGSQLLRQVTQRLNDCAGRLDSVLPIEDVDGRRHRLAVMAGVNFAFMMEHRDTESLLSDASALLEAIDQPFDFEGMTLSVGAQIGIALAPDSGSEPDVVLRNAHIAVEEAANADQRIVVYSEGINRYSARRLSLMGELRTAIQQDALQLAYQPQLHVKSNRIVAVEALLRWQHPRLGFVRPDEFVPLAEQTGVIKPLTAWVLDAAIRQCRAFMDAGLRLAVSVNLSARNLREADLRDRILELLAKYRVPPELLLLEVTETAVMQNPDAALKILSQLDAAGVRSSIDDFGTGYSSLGYLKRLPVSEVKIDRSFVMEMLTAKDDRVIVQTIIDMGRNLGLQVVAEGVENEESLIALREMGCDLAQGYHLCKPIFAEELLAWLQQGKHETAPA